MVSGLAKYMSVEELQNRDVVVICNLKPVKMRGWLLFTIHCMEIHCHTHNRDSISSHALGGLKVSTSCNSMVALLMYFRKR